jgi:micrococcal nuclease
VPKPAPKGKTAATIVKWIDGDTLDVKGEDGKVVRVRMLGINTPEVSTKDGRDVKTYAVETWPKGTNVWLEIDPKQDRIDKYDRLLRHVWVNVDEFVRDSGDCLPVPETICVLGSCSSTGERLASVELLGIRWADIALTYKTYGKTTYHSDLVAAKQEASTPLTIPGSDGSLGGEHPTCAEHRANGEGPFYSGDAEYEQHQDRDDDGVVCE